MAARRDTGLIFLLLLLVLAVAAGLRFYNLDGQSLWSDEGNSVALAARPFAQIARDAANDIHPPLYYFLLRIWTRIFGTTEVALRSLSALLGVLLVLATAELGRRIFSRVTGLTAGILAAAAPFQVYYSQEVRMYILLALEAALALLLFWWWVSQEDRRLPEDASTAAGRRLRWLPFSGRFAILAWAAASTRTTLSRWSSRRQRSVRPVADCLPALRAGRPAGAAVALLTVTAGFYAVAAAGRAPAHHLARC